VQIDGADLAATGQCLATPRMLELANQSEHFIRGCFGPTRRRRLASRSDLGHFRLSPDAIGGAIDRGIGHRFIRGERLVVIPRAVPVEVSQGQVRERQLRRLEGVRAGQQEVLFRGSVPQYRVRLAGAYCRGVDQAVGPGLERLGAREFQEARPLPLGLAIISTLQQCLERLPGPQRQLLEIRADLGTEFAVKAGAGLVTDVQVYDGADRALAGRCSPVGPIMLRVE